MVAHREEPGLSGNRGRSRCSLECLSSEAALPFLKNSNSYLICGRLFTDEASRRLCHNEKT